jgi:mannitol PTS system EIICBA or EIICB component
MSSPPSRIEKIEMRTLVQGAGRFLSAMVMPNIGAFIAWGLITALFIPTGWLPNPLFARLVGPMITWLLPLLIGYTGGQLVHGGRGGVIGAVATAGVIVGSEVPMLLGAMVMGPVAAWVLRGIDRFMAQRQRAGFEMLVNNFSLGIAGGALALLACAGVGPLLGAISRLLAAGVSSIVDARLLPLAHILIEPGKVLFLNNAINHGLLGPIALTQSASTGRSILFLLETNPGPGLGILLAYWLFGSGAARSTAPAATAIHFLGGIHEIYFPYVLMRPRLILAAMPPAMAATAWFTATGAGLVAMPSPGSIFAYVAMTPRGGLGWVLGGVALSTAVSFAVAAVLLRFPRTAATAPAELVEARLRMERLKSGPAVPAASTSRVVRKVVFACDAGMGSSVMGASVLRRKFERAGLGIVVAHAAINEIPADADIVITHRTLTPRARERLPSAEHLSVDDFLKSPVFDELVDRMGATGGPRSNDTEALSRAGSAGR